MDIQSAQSISESYKIWKMNVPFLYNTLQVYQLPFCSQTVDWLPENYTSEGWELNKIIIGTNSITKNYISILDIALPTDDTLVDYSSYQQLSDNENHIAKLGQKQMKVYKSFPQNGQIMRAKACKTSKKQLVAACIGGANYEHFVYDVSLPIQLIEQNKVTLEEHDCEGFGLDWHPTNENMLVSGAFDKKACVWDIGGKSGSTVKPVRVFEHSAGVEDAKWFKKDENLIATAGQDRYICIWDLRETSKRPIITKSAHNGQVYSVDISPFSPYLMLTGGEDTDVNLWDSRNMGRALHRFIGHSSSVTKVQFSHKSPSSFTSCSFDRRVVTWNMSKISEQSSSELQFIHGGHRSKVLDFCWNQKQEVCVSTEQNNVLQVWQMNDKIRS